MSLRMIVYLSMVLSKTESLRRVTASSFAEVKRSERPWLVGFASDDSSLSHKLKYTLQRLYKGEKVTGVNVGLVDCVAEKKLCSILRMRDLPAVVRFSEFKMYRYSGEISHDFIADFALKSYKKTTGSYIPQKPPSLAENLFVFLAPGGKGGHSLFFIIACVLALVAFFVFNFAAIKWALKKRFRSI